MGKTAVRAAGIAILPILTILAGCSSPLSSPTLAAPSSAEARPLTPPAPAWSVATAGAKDLCGAAELQGLIGRPRTDIPVPVRPERQRVACTSCPVTQDESPERLNFFFDAATGLIREIRCG